MRFYNNHDGKIYREIEEYINKFYLECKTCVKDTAVTIRFPNGTDETYLFIDPDRFGDCDWLTCADDFVESEPYVDIVGFVPLDNIRIVGDQIAAEFKGFFPPELIDFYWKYLGFEKPKTVAEAIDECNKALKDKPELDFSGVKMVK